MVAQASSLRRKAEQEAAGSETENSAAKNRKTTEKLARNEHEKMSLDENRSNKINKMNSVKKFLENIVWTR
jgi:hypothetical protein